MTKISSYEELLREKQRLQDVIASQKAEIRQEVQVIRENLEPLTKVLSFVGRFKSRSAPSLLQLGAEAGADFFVRSKLSRAGWLIRTLIPPVIRTAAGSIFNGLKKKVSNSGH